MGPRRVGYFISGTSRFSGELREYAVERERVFESPESELMCSSAGLINANAFPEREYR
jgi:hypothetical protein